MKVLHTVASLRPETGGPARSVPGLASALAAAGIEVHLWAAEVPEDYKPPIGVTMWHAAPDGAAWRDEGFDLIHDHGVWLPINHTVAKAALAVGIPRMVSPRGMLEPWALNHKKWKKRLAWLLYQRRDLQSACALHATAESEAAQLRNLGMKQTIAIIPNGVDMGESLTSVLRPSPSAFKTALFLSRVHPKKGLPLLVEAWDRVRPDGWRMMVVGPDEGGHSAEVERLVARAGLQDSWEFCEACEGEAKQELFAGADLFVLPTYSENFGIVVAEALAYGLPVITTTGTPWEGLLENRCGFWVHPSADGLETALRSATLLSKEERQAMGQRGKSWIARDFLWDGIGTKMSATYHELTIGRGG